MDWLTFFSNIISSLFNLLSKLAWPSVVLLTLYFGKEKIYKLLTSLRSIKYDKLQVDFEVEAVEVLVKTQEELPVTHDDKYEQLRSTLKSVHALPALMTAWNRIESAVEAAYIRSGINEKLRSNMPTFYMQSLMHSGYINKEQFSIFNSLRDLRNRAAHSDFFDLPPTSLENYVDSAVNLISFLDSIAPETENI